MQVTAHILYNHETFTGQQYKTTNHSFFDLYHFSTLSLPYHYHKSEYGVVVGRRYGGEETEKRQASPPQTARFGFVRF